MRRGCEVSSVVQSAGFCLVRFLAWFLCVMLDATPPHFKAQDGNWRGSDCSVSVCMAPVA